MKKEKPKRPSAEPTRTAILKAAKTLFIKKGFAGTSISEIANLAKINQSLIYHHFKNKHNLWSAVKRQTIELFIQGGGIQFEEILQLQDPRQVIEYLVRLRFDVYDKFPELRRIVDWQFLEPNPYEFSGIKKETLNLLIALIENFQNQNRIIPYYAADLILGYIFHAPVGFFKAYKDLSAGFSDNALIKRKQDYVQLCIDSLIKSLVVNS